MKNVDCQNKSRNWEQNLVKQYNESKAFKQWTENQPKSMNLIKLPKSQTQMKYECRLKKEMLVAMLASSSVMFTMGNRGRVDFKKIRDTVLWIIWCAVLDNQIGMFTFFLLAFPGCRKFTEILGLPLGFLKDLKDIW